MSSILAALVLAFQEPSLADISRKAFSSMFDIAVENDRLSIRATSSLEEIEEVYGDLSHSLGARGSIKTPGCMCLWSTSCGGNGSSADIALDPDVGRFSLRYVTKSPPETVEFRQTPDGAVSLVIRAGTDSTEFNQDGKGHCILLIKDGKRVLQLKANSFTALLASQGEVLGKYVLAPLERYFDDVQLCRYSPSVIEMTLGAAPLGSDEAARLKGLICRCGDENIEEREKAVVQLGKFAGKNPSIRFALGRGLDSAVEGETKARLGTVLNSTPRGMESYRVVADQALYRDLDYLVGLLESGHPAKPRLEALTGHRCETLEEWSAWIGQNRARLKWNSDRWKFEP